MAGLKLKRRKLLHTLALLPAGTLLRSSSVSAQPDIVQPAARPKAGRPNGHAGKLSGLALHPLLALPVYEIQ